MSVSWHSRKSHGYHTRGYRRSRLYFEEKLEEISEHDDEQVTGVMNRLRHHTRLPIPMMSAHFRRRREENPQVSRQRCSGGRYSQRVQYYDADGKLVTESFKDTPAKHCSKNMPRWMTLPASGGRRSQRSDHSRAGATGDHLEVLAEEVGKDLDPFDMLCHVCMVSRR